MSENGARKVRAAERRCPDCQLFALRIGDGGSCTGCGEVLTVTELLGLD
jgi:hypothetical protein